MQLQLQDQFLGSLWGGVVGLAWQQFCQANPSAYQLTSLQIWQQSSWHLALSQVQRPLLTSLQQSCAQIGKGHDQNALQLGQLPLTNLGLSPDMPEILLATLPLGFYYHDRPEQLPAALTPVLQIWHQSELQSLGLSLNGALALLMRQQTPIQHLVGQLGQIFNLPELPSLLSQLPTLTTPSLAAFGFGFNCFLATPDQFWLALQQASRSPAMPALASLVAGSLAGTYCGRWGIPLLAPANSQAELFLLADTLLWEWCGVDPTLVRFNLGSPNLIQGLPIAAPGRLRPR